MWREDTNAGKERTADASTAKLIVMLDKSATLGEASSPAEAEARLHAAVHQLLARPGTDDAAACQDALDAVADTYGFAIVLRHELSPSTRMLELVSSRGASDAVCARSQYLRVGQSACGQAALTNAPVIVDNVSVLPDAGPWLQDAVRCLVALPLLSQGEVIGTVTFAARTQIEFRPGIVETMQSFCDMVALWIAHAGLRQRLSQRDAHVQASLLASGALSFEWDIVNDRVRRLYTAEITLPNARTVAETFEGVVAAVHPDDRSRFQQDVRNALSSPDGVYASMHRILRPDGEVRWLTETGRVAFDAGGQPVRLIGISQDITAQKQAENNLRDAEARLRIAETYARQHVGKQREHRQRVERIRIDGAAGRRTAGELADRDRHVVGDEGLAHLDVVRTGTAKAGRVPGVVDAVVAERP